MKAYIIHENEAWTKPLESHLNKLEVGYEDWHVEKAKIDLSQSPPEGIFYNRMSASSHVRGHRFAPEYTSVIINWLRSHKRRIINDGNALALEISKSLQYLKLSESGIKTPRSIFCSSKEQIIQKNNNLNNLFDDLFSIEEVKIYKPDPRVYEIPIKKYEIKSDEITFLSANTWDVSGGGNFGYNSIWVNRHNSVFDILDFQPKNEISNLTQLLDIV